METPETREKLGNAIRELQAKGDTQTIDALVNAYKAKYRPQGATPTAPLKPVVPTPALTQSKVGSLPVIKQLTQFGTGVGSALGNTGLNLGKALLKVSKPVANLLGVGQENAQAQGAIDTINQKMFKEPVQEELDSFAGKTGEFVGNAAPYIATGGATSALANTASGAIKGTGAIPALGRTLAGTGTEAASNFAQGYLLSGGDVNQAKTQGLTAGLLKGTTSGIGEVASAVKLPQRLMGNTYKTDKNVVAKIFDEMDTASEGKTQSLSKWALDKGIRGNLQTQARQVKQILDRSENQVILSAEAAKKRVVVEPNLFKLAQGIMNDFKDVGRGEIAKQADDFLRSVKDNTVSVRDAIKFRRLLDNTLRTKSSFNNPSLADNLAYWAEDLRKTINSIDDLGAINKEYAQAIRAREALIKAATSASNTKALGALESYVFGGGVIAGEPVTTSALIGIKRALQSPRVMSNMAQGLKNLPESSSMGSKTRSVIAHQLGALISPQQGYQE